MIDPIQECFVDFTITGWSFRPRIIAHFDIIRFSAHRETKKPRAQLVFAKPMCIDLVIKTSPKIIKQSWTTLSPVTLEFMLEGGGYLKIEAETVSLLIY